MALAMVVMVGPHTQTMRKGSCRAILSPAKRSPAPTPLLLARPVPATLSFPVGDASPPLLPTRTRGTVAPAVSKSRCLHPLTVLTVAH